MAGILFNKARSSLKKNPDSRLEQNSNSAGAEPASPNLDLEEALNSSSGTNNNKTKKQNFGKKVKKLSRRRRNNLRINKKKVESGPVSTRSPLHVNSNSNPEPETGAATPEEQHNSSAGATNNATSWIEGNNNTLSPLHNTKNVEI